MTGVEFLAHNIAQLMAEVAAHIDASLAKDKHVAEMEIASLAKDKRIAELEMALGKPMGQAEPGVDPLIDGDRGE